ncbi:hypothetical protein E1265_28575 [Streptomyces sp. 8K308]|uniref:hypothetical protein n=1 Tax=Streptomyces sp. 8K308 TaxID=2530388 RepID=UPI001046C467|nr:hypothetical protein [Streptomyces sp. 8K308]TDC13080.1 hypothetical protein E1265_28575 [Streptomyces sp. 8K308]
MPIPPALHFTTDEVEAQAGVAPWDRQRRFRNEINPDDIATTATAYAKAAGETRRVQDLATRASEMSQDPGAWHGDPLVDGANRVIETSEGLRQGGAEIDEVVGYIARAMRAAQDTESNVHNLIHGPRAGTGFGSGGLSQSGSGLNVQYEDHLARARADWIGLEGALELAVNQWAADHQDHLGPPTYWPTVFYDGRERNVDHSQPSRNHFVFDLPQELAQEVRGVHLREAADSATRTYGDMDAEIARYRTNLTEIAGELRRLGYDPTEGPFTLMTNAPMARFAAEQINGQLAAGVPEPHILELHTRNLAGITSDTDDMNSLAHLIMPGAPRELSSRERAYLLSFYDTLSPDALSQLGHLGDNHLVPQTRVANGVNMLMNTEIGGVNPAAGGMVPASIREFVYADENSALFSQSGDQFNTAMNRFNGFGALMETATVASGTQFSKDLGHAAVQIQQAAADRGDLEARATATDMGSGLSLAPNTASSGMLEAAALNTVASADLLNDPAYREDLLSQRWDESRGAAELVHSGTIVPSDVAPNSPEAERYIDAAHGVLTHAGQNGAVITGPNQAELQQSIGNTALTYMDLISRGAATDSLIWEQPVGQEDVVNGKEVRHGFDLSREDRVGLFTFMNGAESQVRDEFFSGVAQWQQGTATHGFIRAEHGPEAAGLSSEAYARAGAGETSTFRNIGTIAGAIAEAQGRNGPQDGTDAKTTALIAITTLTGVGNTVLEAGKFGGATSLGAFGISEGLRHILPDGDAAAQEAHWQALSTGDVDTRVALANAVRAADYHGAAARTAGPPPLDPERDTVVSEWATNVVGNTPFLEDMRDAYLTELAGS